MSSVFATSISGMNAAIHKMMNSAKNIVNASSTGKLPESDGEKSTAYQPTDVISLSESTGDNHFGVTTKTIERTPAYSVAMNPNSPDANEEGLIAVPNVDVSSELVDVMMAKIAYKASAQAIKVEKETQDTLLNTLA